jgi:CDP-diacylglycerol--serine O-phosphatidyltransferase
MIGYYNYTVILTYMSLLSALFGTHLAFSGQEVGALTCLLLCGAFDSFDGIVARTKKGRTEEEKKFGIQIDSLVDMYSFGIFPAIIGYTMGLRGLAWFAIFALYTVCAVIRLGYFNVVEELRQKETTEKRKYYQGLPVTTACLIFPTIYLMNYFLGSIHVYKIYGIVMAFVACAFVIDFKVIKPGLKGILGLGVIGIFIFIGLILL